MKVLSITALLLASPALADPSVEVMHFWTSGGEATVLGAVRDLVEAGIIPLAHGGQAWQEAYMPEAVAAGMGGADFYRKALIELDDATLRGTEMVAVCAQMATLRSMGDPNFPSQDWNLALAMVINGEAAMQIMGDWAQGEVITHAANAAVVGAATDAITAFFNSDQTPEDATTALADASAAAR